MIGLVCFGSLTKLKSVICIEELWLLKKIIIEDLEFYLEIVNLLRLLNVRILYRQKKFVRAFCFLMHNLMIYFVVDRYSNWKTRKGLDFFVYLTEELAIKYALSFKHLIFFFAFCSVINAVILDLEKIPEDWEVCSNLFCSHNFKRYTSNCQRHGSFMWLCRPLTFSQVECVLFEYLIWLPSKIKKEINVK